MQKTTGMWKMSDDQHDLFERFVAAYNSIHQILRKHLGKEDEVPFASFASLVRDYGRMHRSGSDCADCDYLRMAAKLRNVLLHETTKPYQRAAVPTLPVVERLERICQRLKNPPLVVPRFQTPVETTTLDDSLAGVLRRIRERDYSQFPVYDGEKFCGLLTENGITRWLAHHVSKEMSLVELDEVPVSQVLSEEEKRQNCLFLARDKTVDEAKALFAANELLEAVLITQSGNRTEKPIGIITRWDVLREG
jgi:predicted transcriptional regulator